MTKMNWVIFDLRGLACWFSDTPNHNPYANSVGLKFDHGRLIYVQEQQLLGP